MGDGRGTPLGPMETGRPEDPNLILDPNQMQGFDYSPIKKQLLEDFALQGGNAQRNYLAGASKALGSGTTSGSMQGRLANIAAQTQRNQNQALTDLALKEWQDKKEMMDAYNRAKMARYGMDQEAFNQEQAGRAGFWGSALGAGAQGLGAYLGGRK